MIEPASLQDAEEILDLINRTNREAYRDVIPPEYFREPILTLAELWEAMGRMSFYLYRSAGRAVGVAALSREDAETGKLRFVYVLPECQRQGIGTALVSFLEERARTLGLRRLCLRTVGSASWAVAFYRKLGYRLAGQIEMPWGQDLLMEKEVRMQIGVQVSLYPLAQADLLPAIQDIWDALREAGLHPEPGPLSTLVYGEDDVVLRALGEGFRRAAARGPAVMVITLSNACPGPART